MILTSPMLAVELEFYVMVEQVASPPASWKVLERRVFERYWGMLAQLKDNGGAGWKILENTHPGEKYWKIPGLVDYRKLSGLCWVVG